jgi:cytochrome P450
VALDAEGGPRNTNAPASDMDLHTDAALSDPYPLYRRMRDLGAVVWMERYAMFALSRFHDVRAAAANADVFSSAQGVGFSAFGNMATRGTTLASDAPLHDALRNVVSKPLSPTALKALSGQIAQEAETLVEGLVAKGEFDAVADLAWHLPLTIVSKLVGIDEQSRQRMPAWSAAAFNSGGPDNARARASLPTLGQMIGYLSRPDLRDTLAPGGWGAQIYEAADRGEIAHSQCAMMLGDYLGPSLDTTMSATASAIWLLGQNPDQWALLREDPSLIPNAVLEAIRLESPIQIFTRVATQDIEIEGVVIPGGARVMLLYGSANRDERRWEDPDRFDVKRKVFQHLGFGHGVHTCVGMHLARLEIQSLLTALAKRVDRLELGEAHRQINNGLRSLESLRIRLH